VAGLVFGHFVNGVVNGIVIELLCLGGEFVFPGTGTDFGFNALLQVRLGAGGENFAEEFG
jgi:hypothetical protein